MAGRLTEVGMTKEAFRDLFDRALEVAAENAEKALERQIPRRFEVLWGSVNSTGPTLTPDEAFEKSYLGPDSFYRIIDIMVTRVCDDTSFVFMRPSEHQPNSFDRTWNQPPGNGPFKQLLARQIKSS